jgi:murein DD-endopeptidase MepM/ murein hydrolase activator NlpD
VRSRIAQKIHLALERRFPEQRLFLRSDTETRFIRIKPSTQLLIWTGGSLLVGWTIIATAILLMDSIGSGNYRAQAQRNQSDYEMRLNALSAERDSRAIEASAAQERFSNALQQISVMQSELLASEDKWREMATGIEVIQATLRRTMREREDARDQAESLTAQLTGGDGAVPVGASTPEMNQTVDLLTDALAKTAAERDKIEDDAQYALDHATDVELELRLLQERNTEIFGQLEAAMQISVEPLEQMFRNAGMNPDDLIAQVRRGYSGTGGPLTPMQFSTRGGEPDPDALRANGILARLDAINLYRIAAQKAPFGMPVRDAVRYTSGFGSRWGRLHAGQDLAAPIGTPVFASGDGVVISAGWSSGYGRLIKIQHDFGIETRYGHLNAIRVQVGQRVSRGERIGDMGNSGRSTGPHLHYEVRVGGTPVNPMTYMRAGQDVF